MKLVKMYKDDFGNMASIEKGKILPYKDSPIKEMAYRLTLCAMYDSFIYYVSIYESMEKALEKLSEFSCNSWKEV